MRCNRKLPRATGGTLQKKMGLTLKINPILFQAYVTMLARQTSLLIHSLFIKSAVSRPALEKAFH